MSRKKYKPPIWWTEDALYDFAFYHGFRHGSSGCLCKHGMQYDEDGDDISGWEPGYKLCSNCCNLSGNDKWQSHVNVLCYYCLAEKIAKYIFRMSINHRAMLLSHYKTCRKGGDIDEDSFKGHVKEGSSWRGKRQDAPERALKRK